MNKLLITILVILSTAHAGEKRQPNHLSLVTALVAATGYAEGDLHIFDYDCTEGQHIGWLECKVEYTAIKEDDLKTAENLGVKARK